MSDKMMPWIGMHVAICVLTLLALAVGVAYDVEGANFQNGNYPNPFGGPSGPGGSSLAGNVFVVNPLGMGFVVLNAFDMIFSIVAAGIVWKLK